MGRLVLGLDIGITSVGYGVIDIDENKFVDYGVRLFKEGGAKDNQKRRTSRSHRRLLRRRSQRIEDMTNLLKINGIMSENYHHLTNPYEIRAKGLTEKLTNDELTCALLHLTKNRGTTIEGLDNADDKDSEGTKATLSKNAKALAKEQYICKVQLTRLQERGFIRGIDNNFKTDDYVNEAKEILKHQNLDETLNKKIITIIARRRKYYEGPGSEKSPTPYGRWTDYGVAPIDLIAKMRGHCSVYPEELRAPKCSYTAEMFNLLNDLNNLTVDGNKLTVEEKHKIIDFVNKKGGITFKQLMSLLEVDDDLRVKGFRVNSAEKPIITEFKGYKTIKKVLDKHHCLDYQEHKEMIDTIADILTSKKGATQRAEAFKEQYPDLTEELINDLSVVKGISGYHSLSFKAMRLLNEEMIQSPLNQMQLLYELNLFDKNRKSMKGQKHIQANNAAILSPVTKRAQRETFKVINKLREIYGEFDTIVVETPRDKNDKDRKKRIRKAQDRNAQNNKKVDDLLTEKGYAPNLINGKTKQKIRLYLDQDSKTAYTLDPIDLNFLLSHPDAYEIDHIIPLSVSLDDSYDNKVLVTRDENQLKGQRTPYSAFLSGKFKGTSLLTYKTFVLNHKGYSNRKKQNLLFDEDINQFATLQKFINRNLVDTSYATRVVMNTLTDYFKDNNIPTKIHTVRGKITHLYRTKIHLPKDREEDYLHHAIDALIVASIKKVPLMDTFLAKCQLEDLYNEKTGEIYPVGENEDVYVPSYLSFIANLKTIYEQSNQYYNGYITRNEMKFKPIKFSHKVDTKPNRQFADETIYSTRMTPSGERVVKKINPYEPKQDKLVNSIINQDKVEDWLMQQHDSQTFAIIQDIILDHFNIYKDDSKFYAKETKNGKTAYKLKGENPLSIYKNEHGMIRKYAKKNNGPEIKTMKYLEGRLNSHVPITQNYQTTNKSVVLLQISPYRTDFYISPKGKYSFVTIKYKDVKYQKNTHTYVIAKTWYNKQKANKHITDDWTFVCSMHHDELIGIKKKDGDKYIYDSSKNEENKGKPRVHHGEYEILKFVGTNDDTKNTIQVAPIYMRYTTQLTVSIGPFTAITKFSTDVLGNLYEIKDNVLRLEF